MQILRMLPVLLPPLAWSLRTCIASYTLPAVPTRAPVVKLESLGPTAILVTWTPLSGGNARGIIQQYKIFYRVKQAQHYHTETTHGSIDRYVITGSTRTHMQGLSSSKDPVKGAKFHLCDKTNGLISLVIMSMRSRNSWAWPQSHLLLTRCLNWLQVWSQALTTKCVCLQPPSSATQSWQMCIGLWPALPLHSTRQMQVPLPKSCGNAVFFFLKMWKPLFT